MSIQVHVNTGSAYCEIVIAAGHFPGDGDIPPVDVISPSLLQRGIKKYLHHLVEIGKNSLAVGYIPRTWRRLRNGIHP